MKDKIRRRPIYRIAEALDTPTDMFVRVLRPLIGVKTELQPEIGRIYPAVRGRAPKNNLAGRDFCYIRVNDHVIVLRSGSETGMPSEYEEILPRTRKEAAHG
jgi:hypothetical protein